MIAEQQAGRPYMRILVCRSNENVGNLLPNSGAILLFPQLL